jgi:beta-phosphoglucomutase-like phosphatase (HAD superfamily)
MNVQRCVASSSSGHRVIQSLKLTDQLRFFSEESIFTSQQVSKGKPAPDLFLFAASQMGFAPKNCIVIEDSPAGIEAAKAAGMTVICFLGGSHTHYEWYREKMSIFNIPIARNGPELLSHLQKQFTF